MSVRNFGSIVVALVVCAATSVVNGQESRREGRRGWRDGPPQFGPRDGGPGFRGDRGGDRGGNRGDRGGDRGRGGPPSFTPEQRDEFYNRMAERYAERFTRNYELTEEQQAQVRAQLEEVKTQQRAYSEPRREQFETLRNEMRQLWEGARDGGQFDRQRAEELRNQMRSLWEGAPLFNRENVMSQIEKLLPPEQVERGRSNYQTEEAEEERQREQRRAEWEQRRQEWEQRRQEGGGPPMDREEMRRRWMERRQQDGEDADGSSRNEDRGGREGFREDRGDRGDSRRDRGGDDGERGGEVQPIREDPIGPWERYLRDFSRRYQLDQAQRATAESVLREVQERRTAHELQHKVDYEQARAMGDSRQGQARLDELNRPVVQMFEELKARLRKIPSTAQLRAAGDFNVSTSQPATTTRPADAADERLGDREDHSGRDRRGGDRGRDRERSERFLQRG